ncbi:antibiotic biosynthesis monooxygenase [Streptococcus caviae]|uniref:putative quinol monooxygenase n=1 Tax=Streptococcus sp. 'caviae' TaxID=1915004 RepID=UPI000ADAC4E0|nr:antibiotic biosynthesis monooxygenase [Streptococcus sp. 'caviae']
MTATKQHKKVILVGDGAVGLSVRLSQLEVSDSRVFSAIVIPEMRASMKTEAGVLVMYAGRDTANPSIWYFFEVYQNEAAYSSHCQTPNFKDYIKRSGELVLNKDLQVLAGEMLVHQ